MRRLAVLALITLLPAVGVGHAASGQTPELADRLELAGGRVEVAEAGYALTLPVGWRIVRPVAADLDAIAANAREVVPELAPAVEAMMASGNPLSLVAFGPAREDRWSADCTVVASAAGGRSTDEIVRAEMAGLERVSAAVTSGPDPVLLELPIGDVWRFDYRMSHGGMERAGSAHLIHVGESLYVLTCTDWERPDDSWLSIAESFELLPRTSESVEHRYRIRWPVGWAAIGPYLESSPWLHEHADRGDEVCVLVDEHLVPGSPGWTLDARAGQQVEDFPDRERSDVTGLHRSVERAARIDKATGAAYLFATGDRLFSLVCDSRTGVPPDDRWLSIAQTFEFLTDGGPSEPDRIPTSSRLESPEDGYAIRIPAGWVARDLTEEVHMALYGEPSPDGETPYLSVQHLDSEAFCTLSDFAEYAEEPPAFVDVDDATDNWVLDGDEVRFLETAAGRVGRVTGVDEDGWVNQIYVYRQADRWVYLECWAPGPEEGFAVVGESFEFLPAEE
ncbi:MAG: hypothetical protein PVG27_04860 [Chloroflexota bacterium]